MLWKQSLQNINKIIDRNILFFTNLTKYTSVHKYFNPSIQQCHAKYHEFLSRTQSIRNHEFLAHFSQHPLTFCSLNFYPGKYDFDSCNLIFFWTA